MINLSHMGLSTVTMDLLSAEIENEDDPSSKDDDDDDDDDDNDSDDRLSSITGLDLSHNRMTDLDFLSRLPRLQTLILDHNELGSHLRLPVLPALHTFWANHNRVSNVAILVSTLRAAAPGLRYLSLMNNPCAPSYLNGGTVKAYRDYRHFVIGKLTSLTDLDDRPVAKLERAEAEKVYGAFEL